MKWSDESQTRWKWVFALVVGIVAVLILFSNLLDRPYVDQIRDSAQKYAYNAYPGRWGKIVCETVPNSSSRILPCIIHFDDGTHAYIECVPRHCDSIKLNVEFTNTK